MHIGKESIGRINVISSIKNDINNLIEINKYNYFLRFKENNYDKNEFVYWLFKIDKESEKSGCHNCSLCIFCTLNFNKIIHTGKSCLFCWSGAGNIDSLCAIKGYFVFNIDGLNSIDEILFKNGLLSN